MRKREPRVDRPFATFVREVLSVGFLIVGLTAARSSLADHYIVPSGSMQPTLVPGDRVVVDKRAYGLRVPFTLEKLGEGAAPRRGDVVIVDSPRDGERLIKRVVATAGDEVAVRAGHVYIDGVALGVPGDPLERFETRVVPLDLSRGGGPDFGPVRVPAGRLLVMGDNRGNSLDGREFGFVDENAVYARAERVFWRDGEGFTWREL
jgi:signal peptidase I